MSGKTKGDETEVFALFLKTRFQESLILDQKKGVCVCRRLSFLLVEATELESTHPPHTACDPLLECEPDEAEAVDADRGRSANPSRRWM